MVAYGPIVRRTRIINLYGTTWSHFCRVTVGIRAGYELII